MASALEQFVNSVRQLSAQGQMTQLCELINKSGELLAKNLSHLDTVLGALDVQEHSLGVLAVLFVKFSMPSVPDFETLFSQVQLFISTCNGEHIRYATDTFAGLCHQLTNALVERKQPLRGIGVLKQAIDKMQMNTNQLTSVHADLCQLCLLAKCFKPALPYLDVDMVDICKENGAYEAKHFLCYYYYGGMVYTGLKNFERALYFYEQAIATPAMAVSHIMLEAYKKYILVSLILLGKVQQLPKYTSQIVGRFIKPLSNAYHELAQVYSTNNPSELRNLVTKHSETFTRDNNMGLVKQCLSSLYKKNIQRLTKTFLTLSLQDMASRVQLSGPQEAEKYVLHMIEDGEIFASINQKDGMVSFHDNPEKYNNPAMLHNIDQEMLRCIELDERLRAMDQEITVNPQFVQKVTEAPSFTEWAGRGRVAFSIRSVSLCPETISGRFTETYSLGTFPDSRLEVCLGMRVGVLDLPPPYTGWRHRGVGVRGWRDTLGQGRQAHCLSPSLPEHGVTGGRFWKQAIQLLLKPVLILSFREAFTMAGAGVGRAAGRTRPVSPGR
uniref:COP9 signalosome complex subunit 3 n=1 Tax=Balaenoptera musculus TaxID=9771 RepID=A0A8C0I5G1_BALMU